VGAKMGYLTLLFAIYCCILLDSWTCVYRKHNM